MASALEVLSESTLTSFSQNVYRNIVSLIVSEDLFDDLTDDPQDLAMLDEVVKVDQAWSAQLTDYVRGMGEFADDIVWP